MCLSFFKLFVWTFPYSPLLKNIWVKIWSNAGGSVLCFVLCLKLPLILGPLDCNTCTTTCSISTHFLVMLVQNCEQNFHRFERCLPPVCAGCQLACGSRTPSAPIKAKDFKLFRPFVYTVYRHHQIKSTKCPPQKNLWTNWKFRAQARLQSESGEIVVTQLRRHATPPV